MKYLCIWLALFVIMGMTLYSAMSHASIRQKRWRKIKVSVRSVLREMKKSGNSRVRRDTIVAENRRSRYFTERLSHRVERVTEQYKANFSSRIENVSRGGNITNGGCKKWKRRHKKVRESLPMQVVAAMSFWKYLQWASDVEKKCIEANELTKNWSFGARFDEISSRVEEWLDLENDSLSVKTYKRKVPILMPPTMDVKSLSNYVTYLTHEILQNFVSFLNCFNLDNSNNSCVIWSRCPTRNKNDRARKDKKKRKHRRRKGKKGKSEVAKHNRHRGKKEKTIISNGRKHRGKKEDPKIGNGHRHMGNKEDTKINNGRKHRGRKEDTKIINGRKHRGRKEDTKISNGRKHRGRKENTKIGNARKHSGKKEDMKIKKHRRHRGKKEQAKPSNDLNQRKRGR